MSYLSIWLAVTQIAFVTLIFFQQQKLRWDTHCSLRREMLHLSAIVAFQEALVQSDYETAVGAITEWQHHSHRELQIQEERHWSLRHPLRMPPLPDEVWA